MKTIPKKIKLPNSDKPEIIDFRQLESLTDACEAFGNAPNLLIFINTYLIEHDRKQLRYHAQHDNTAQLMHYKKFACFISEE